MTDESKGTEYVVLCVVTGDQGAAVADYVYEVGRARAANDVAAIKAVAKDHSGSLGDGAYAVPARSWRLRKAERRVQETTLWT